MKARSFRSGLLAALLLTAYGSSQGWPKLSDFDPTKAIPRMVRDAGKAAESGLRGAGQFLESTASAAAKAAMNAVKQGSAAATATSNAWFKSQIAPIKYASEGGKAALSSKPLDSLGKVTTKELRDTAIRETRALSEVAKFSATLKDGQSDLTKLMAKGVLGDVGELAGEAATAGARLESGLTVSAAEYAKAVAEGKNPLMLAAVPLAAALRAAHAQHAPNAKPIPPAMLERLEQSKVFSAKTLGRARYAIGNVEISLPNLIGRGHKVFGDGYAVTIDDLIIFNSAPPLDVAGTWWWAHEMWHVEQYGKWGHEEFAYRYLIWTKVEKAADERANAVIERLNPNDKDRVNSLVAKAMSVVVEESKGLSCKKAKEPDRRISVAYWGAPSPLPCSVQVYKSVPGIVQVSVPAHADSVVGRCEKSALAEAEKLRLAGFTCD